METLYNKIEQNIKYVIIIFIIIQLFLDMISGIQVNILEKNTLLSPIMRLSLFIFCLYYIFIINKNKINFKTLLTTYFSYIALIIIPNITNISFNRYSHSKLDNVRWFLLTDTIENILSMLLPFIIIYLIKSKTKKFNLINIEYRLSIILILLITLFVGHTLISPAVSIFVALIITLILNGGIHEKIN